MQQHHVSPELLVDFLHGELDPAQDAAIHAHLAACGDCRELHDAEAALTEVLRAAAVAEERELPPIVKAQIWAQVREARPGWGERLSGWFRPVVAIPAAAVLAVALIAYPIAHQHGANGATIAASYYLEEHAAQSQENPLADRSGATQMMETSFDASQTSDTAPSGRTEAAVLTGDGAP